MKLIQTITKPVSEMFADQGAGHSEAESQKRKFVVTVKDKDGQEVEKNVKAYSITDIKHHFGKSFVSAELHPDEQGTAEDDEEDDDRTADEMDADAEADAEPTRPMPKQRANNAAEAGRGPSAKDVTQEAMTTPAEKKKKDFDFQRMMAGAMSRDEFNQKWKVGKYAPKPNKLAGPGGLYKNLLVKLGEAAAPAPEGEYKVGSTVIYKTVHKGHHMMSTVKSVRDDALLLMNGSTIQPKAVVSTNAKDWEKYSLEEAKTEQGYYVVSGRPGEWEFVAGPFDDKNAATTECEKQNRGHADYTVKFLKKKPLTEGIITEMAKRTTPAEFYKLAVAKHGAKNAGYMSWAMIKAVADDADILIPAYIRDNKIGRGVWDAKPKDMKADAHEPPIAKKDEPKADAPKAGPSKDAVDRTVSRMVGDVMAKTAPKKEEPKKDEGPKGAPVPEKKDHYEKHDFDVEFAWTTSYSEPRELYAAIKQHHGVEHTDTERKQVGKSGTGRHGVVLATYYIVKKGTMDVLGSWTVTGADKIPGRGFVSYGTGHIAMSKKAIKNRDDNRYGFLIKPQHGSPYISVGTQHSHGPWDEFSAKANVQDKYQHFEYDDEFGHGTISVVKVVKKDGKWVRA